MKTGNRLLLWLASPRWMLAFFVFAILSAWTVSRQPEWVTALWVPPLAMFALSLLAAIATNPRFRRDISLLGLHLALLMFVLLLAYSRLTYLDGAVTLNRGKVFDGRLHLDRRGPLHVDRLASLRFVNEGFVESFGQRARWRATRNRVRWWDAHGQSHVAEIGDDTPLVIDNYRIYTTFNRGYSPVFRWTPTGGEPETGAVQLHAGRFDRANSWRLPGGPEIWALLQTPRMIDLQRGQQRANLGEADLQHQLVIRTLDQRVTMSPGDSLQLPQGVLTYLALDSWMGYRVVYDIGMYWIAAAAAAVVGCMMAFYSRLLRRRGSPETEQEQRT